MRGLGPALALSTAMACTPAELKVSLDTGIETDNNDVRDTVFDVILPNPSDVIPEDPGDGSPDLPEDCGDEKVYLATEIVKMFMVNSNNAVGTDPLWCDGTTNSLTCHVVYIPTQNDDFTEAAHNLGLADTPVHVTLFNGTGTGERKYAIGVHIGDSEKIAGFNRIDPGRGSSLAHNINDAIARPSTGGIIIGPDSEGITSLSILYEGTQWDLGLEDPEESLDKLNTEIRNMGDRIDEFHRRSDVETYETETGHTYSVTTMDGNCLDPALTGE